MSEAWSLQIERDRCMGSGTCLVYAPDLLELDAAGKAAVRADADDDIEAAFAAADACPVGALRVVVESCDQIMPGVVSLPHGFGHDRLGTRLTVASQHAGVSCNDITDELALDALSGNAAVNGIAVEVTAA